MGENLQNFAYAAILAHVDARLINLVPNLFNHQASIQSLHRAIIVVVHRFFELLNLLFGGGHRRFQKYPAHAFVQGGVVSEPLNR